MRFENKYFAKFMSKLNLIVLEAAKFIDVKLEQHPEEGEDAEIVCRVRGDPSLEIFWQFEGKTILEGLFI